MMWHRGKVRAIRKCNSFDFVQSKWKTRKKNEIGKQKANATMEFNLLASEPFKSPLHCSRSRHMRMYIIVSAGALLQRSSTRFRLKRDTRPADHDAFCPISYFYFFYFRFVLFLLDRSYSGFVLQLFLLHRRTIWDKRTFFHHLIIIVIVSRCGQCAPSQRYRANGNTLLSLLPATDEANEELVADERLHFSERGKEWANFRFVH